MNDMEDLKKEVYEYLKERDWLQHVTPPNVAKAISIEAAELLELFQWSNPSTEEVKHDPELMEKLKSELADILIYCFNITAVLDLDTEALMREKMEKVRQKYPAGGVADLDEYWKIKKEHRRNNA